MKEKKKFIEAHEKYGQCWDKISKYVETKSK